MNPAITIVAVLLALAGAVFAWRFVWIYRRHPFNWRAYDSGRHLMRFTFVIGITLSWTVIGLGARTLFGSVPWLEATLSISRVVIFAVVAWMLWERLRLLEEARAAATKEEEEARDSHAL